MTPEFVTVEIEDGVGIVTLNRPEKLNAMNSQLNVELHEAVKELNDNPEIGCVVVTGSGNRAFSAGGDIHEQRENDAKYTLEELDARGAGRARGGFDMALSPKPIIAMVNGLAYGGGSVLASSLDFRIGCEHASFRFLATAYGRINSTWTLPNQVGWPMAKELLFTARVVEAEESYRIGLLNHLVPCEQLREKTMEIATAIAKNKQESVIGVKHLLNKQIGKELEEQWLLEKDYTTNVSRGARAEEAFPEFIARRGRPLSS